MSKYDNYIYLTICEVSLETYKKTNYTNYVEYCKGMCLSLNRGDVSKSERRGIEAIVKLLDKVFSMSPDETGRYIGQYFSLPPSRHQAFELSVRLTQEAFPTYHRLA